MRNSLRLSKWFLRKWYRYEKHIHELDQRELDKARILFQSLQQLTKSEIMFLADKYNREERPIRDDILANGLKMDIKEYVQQRKQIEEKLYKYIIQIQKGE